MTTIPPLVFGSFLVRGFNSAEEAAQWHPHGIPDNLSQRTERSAQRALRAQEERALRQEQVDAIKSGKAYTNYLWQVDPWERKPSQPDHLLTPRLNDPDFPSNLELWNKSLEILWGPPPGIHMRFLSSDASGSSERITESPSSQDTTPTRRGDASNSSQDIVPSCCEMRSPSPNRTPPPEKTPSQKTIQQRIKQIGYGKNTAGYRNYRDSVPLESREPDNPLHPVTPRLDTTTLRPFKRELRDWRRELHKWDDQAPPHFSENACSAV
jgi:hypothetical protein